MVAIFFISLVVFLAGTIEILFGSDLSYTDQRKSIKLSFIQILIGFIAMLITLIIINN